MWPLFFIHCWYNWIWLVGELGWGYSTIGFRNEGFRFQAEFDWVQNNECVKHPFLFVYSAFSMFKFVFNDFVSHRLKNQCLYLSLLYYNFVNVIFSLLYKFLKSRVAVLENHPINLLRVLSWNSRFMVENHIKKLVHT